MLSKEQWTNDIIQFLKQIASEEFQEKGWVKGEIHDYCRFASTICGLFELSDFDDFIDQYAAQFGLNEQQIMKLDMLRNALNDYITEHGCYQEPETVINDPEWIRIRKLAKEALESLHVGKYLDPAKALPKEALLSLISRFARSRFQQRAWVEERRPGKNPFRIQMMNFFNSYVYKTQEIIDHYKDYEITAVQKNSLVAFYQILKSYWEKHYTEEDITKILKDPEWHHIQALAAELLITFQWKSPEERNSSG